MRRLCTTGCLLLICLAALATGPAVRAGEPPADPRARLARLLRSPVAAERAQAVAEAVGQGGAARTWARAWLKAEDPRLRGGAWAVLAHVGVSADARVARSVLRDPDPTVARRAAEALVRMAERLPVEGEPWLPARSLEEREIRALTWVLATRLEEAPDGNLPSWFLRLGEGVIPCLEHLLTHPRFDTAPRRAAIGALAAIGGDDARQALSDLVPMLEAKDDRGLWEAWWRGLIEVGPGKGLGGAHALVIRFTEFARSTNFRQRPPGLRWRSEAYFYRFLATCPPAEGIDAVRGYLDERLERAAEGGRWRLWPSLAPDMVRAHLVIAEPDDERLEWDALAARPPPRHGWRRRQEELGHVLVHLEPYRSRAGLQTGLTLLLEHRDLPRTVRAWALYLQGETEQDVLRTQAAALIDAGGAAATLAQRRLGARLLDRLGPPTPKRIRTMLGDLDGWMRAMGLRWSARAVADGRLPAEEHAASLRKARRDADRGVFLLAAELSSEPIPAAERERLLAIALSGPRTLRARAWKAIDRDLPGGASPWEDPFDPVPGHASLDERLRAAALARSLWASRRR